MINAEIKKQGNDFVISGPLSFTTVVPLWNKSLELFSGKAGLHFDLNEVTSSNSAGVALLLEWVRFAKEYHRAIDFKNIPPQLHSIISVSGIEKLISIV